MDCRAETHLREKQARGTDASLPEGTGDLQQQVRGQKHPGPSNIGLLWLSLSGTFKNQKSSFISCSEFLHFNIFTQR